MKTLWKDIQKQPFTGVLYILYNNYSENFRKAYSKTNAKTNFEEWTLCKKAFLKNLAKFREIKFVMETSFSTISQKVKFSNKDFFSKCDQINRKLRIWSHLLKKSLMENFNFCAAYNCRPLKEGELKRGLFHLCLSDNLATFFKTSITQNKPVKCYFFSPTKLLQLSYTR